MVERYSLPVEGRTLSFAVHGEREGAPIVFFPGLGHDCTGCLAAPPGVRILVVDRPGIGGSSRVAGRTITAFAKDIERVLERVGIASFSVLAWSAGAPYALAVIERLHDRVDAATFYGAIAPPASGIPLDGMDPAARAMWRLAARSARLVRVQLMALCAAAHRNPRQLTSLLHHGAPSCDRIALAEPTTHAMYARAYRGAVAMGSEGLADEMALLARPWDVDLNAIDGRMLRFVYGQLDRLTPVGIGRGMVAVLSGSRLTEVPAAGHLLIWERWQNAVREALCV